MDYICTMWKFQDFSVIQILHETNFGEFRSSNAAIFKIFGDMNFVDLVNFRHQKVQKYMKNQNPEP